MGCKLEFYNPPDLKWGTILMGGNNGIFKLLFERTVDILACAQYRNALAMKVMTILL